MAKQNITYFLGAGASFNKLPVIDNMPERIEQIRNHFMGNPSINYRTNDSLMAIVELLKLVALESKRFNTVDTYARKLFLNERFRDLVDLKVALSICFAYWQLFDQRSGIDFKPSPNIDHRYISLISAFLQKDQRGFLYIPEHIKFITWNYDIQLELALKYFTDYRAKELKIADVQSIYKSIPNLNNDIAKPTIVHLNGIAGMISQKSGVENFADFIGERNYSDLHHFLSIAISYYKDYYNPQTTRHYEYFSYSWEQNSVTSYALQCAANIMKETDILVIIGYSFPVFNRETDRKLFGDSRKFKVYYQDPKADKIALANIFDIPMDRIFEEKKHEQFFLPHEF